MAIEPVYGPEALGEWNPSHRLGEPGEYPFTRGPYTTMYRGQLWTMRQYAGFGTAEVTNTRFRALLEAGQTGLSVAFDLPTQMGFDSDHDMAAGEVGKVGVAVDSLDDMRRLFAGIPLGQVTTSMTINSTAAPLLLLYQLVAEEQGVSPRDIRGTIQNDILKEYIARGTYIYPVAPSMRLVTDLFAYSSTELPHWNMISISGYHIREAGATAAQEVAFAIANGLAYLRSARIAGLDLNVLAPRLSFFWSADNGFFEEVAKYRAARRMWAVLMREVVGTKDPRSWRMRFHTQTAGSTLTAQQSHNNIVRTTIQAMAAVLGGTQSLHTNSYDEALGLPTEEAAKVALRTQQILAYESGLTDTVDPLAGSYYLESLTDLVEKEARVLLDRIDALGGAVAAIEQGFPQRAIEDAAYDYANKVERKEKVVVGVNDFLMHEELDTPIMSIADELELQQRRRLDDLRERRDSDVVKEKLVAMAETAASGGNLLYPMKEALTALATVGEVSAALEDVFGRY